MDVSKITFGHNFKGLWARGGGGGGVLPYIECFDKNHIVRGKEKVCLLFSPLKYFFLVRHLVGLLSSTSYKVPQSEGWEQAILELV